MAGDNVSAADTDGFEKPVVDAFAAGEEALLGVVAESVKARITGRVSRGQGLKAFRKSARKVVTDTISRGVAASRAALDRAAEAGRAVARRVIERQRRAPDPSPLAASPDTPTPNTGGLTAEQLRATAPKAPRSARGVTVRTPKALVPGVQAMAPTLLANAEGLYKEIAEAVIAAPLESEAARRRLAQSMLDKAAARGITGFVDAAERRWSMVSYIEMATRTAATQTAVEAHAQMLVDNGHDLVRVSVHPNCSPMCAPFQGHLLSLTGATSAAGPEPWRKRVVATFAEAKARGFLHVNCRHFITMWLPGDPLPDAPEVDPDDYTAEQDLRKLERSLRTANRRRAVALDPDAERKADAQARNLRNAITEHLNEHPTLQRQPEREKVNLGYETDEASLWPKIPDLNPPNYSNVDDAGVARSTNFIGPDGLGEPLPALSRMPGHVIFGWRDDDERHYLDDRRGHRHDSARSGATTFPEAWSDQDIVDRVLATVENPSQQKIRKNPKVAGRVVRREFDGVVIEARWAYVNGQARELHAYPVRGPGVYEIIDGRPQTVQHPNKGDRLFEEVTSDGV